MYIPGKQWLTFGNGRLQADNYRRIRRIISNYCFKIYLVRRNGTNRFLLLFLTSLQFSSSSSPYCGESISAMCVQMGLFIRRLPSRQKKKCLRRISCGFQRSKAKETVWPFEGDKWVIAFVFTTLKPHWICMMHNNQHSCRFYFDKLHNTYHLAARILIWPFLASIRNAQRLS